MPDVAEAEVVGVGAGVRLGEAVADGAGVRLGDGEGDGVETLGTGVGDGRGVALEVALGLGVALAVGAGVRVGEEVGLGVAVGMVPAVTIASVVVARRPPELLRAEILPVPMRALPGIAKGTLNAPALEAANETPFAPLKVRYPA